MEDKKEADEFNYHMKALCRSVKKRLDEMAIEEVKKESFEKGIKIGEEKGIKIGEEKGIKIGEEKGIKIGEKKGKELTIRGIIQQFYNIGISIDKICQATKKSPKEVKEIIQSEKVDGQEASFQQRKVLEA